MGANMKKVTGLLNAVFDLLTLIVLLFTIFVFFLISTVLFLGFFLNVVFRCLWLSNTVNDVTMSLNSEGNNAHLVA